MIVHGDLDRQIDDFAMVFGEETPQRPVVISRHIAGRLCVIRSLRRNTATSALNPLATAVESNAVVLSDWGGIASARGCRVIGADVTLLDYGYSRVLRGMARATETPASLIAGPTAGALRHFTGLLGACYLGRQ